MADSRETITVTAMLTSARLVEDGIVIFNERTAITQPRRRQVITDPTTELVEALYPAPKSRLKIGLERFKALRRPRTSPAFPVVGTSE